MPERNKVIYNGTTLIDLTEDSVTPDTLAYGATAHSASGDLITGTAYKNTYYVKGMQNSSTGLWTGNLQEVSALYEGLSIDYWLPFDGSGNATLNLTLKDGTATGPIDCYYSGTSRLSTQIPANNIMRLIYQTVTISGASYTGWWLAKSYNTNDSGLMSIQTPSIFSGTINFRKINGIVQINAHRINLVSSVSSGNYIELGTIPAGFRPQSGFYPASVSGSSNQIGTGFNLLAYNIGSVYSQPFVVEINPNGTIVLYATVSTVHTTDNINISAMYFTD